jgi:hypothetical protein
MPEITASFEPFATADDLEIRWRELKPDERTRAEVILMDASALISTLCEQSKVALPTAEAPNPLLATNLKAVCCDVCKRSMLSPEDKTGVKSAQQMAGNYMEMFTFDSPPGDLYLTASEKRRLGIGRQRISFINTLGSEQTKGEPI